MGKETDDDKKTRDPREEFSSLLLGPKKGERRQKKNFLEFDAQTTRREDARGAATAGSHSSISIRTIGANPARVSADRASQKSTDARETIRIF